MRGPFSIIRNNRVLKVLSFVLSLTAASAFAAESDVKQTPGHSLLKMQQAMKHLNYQGTVAFLRNGKLNVLKYSHASTNGIGQERLVSLNSPLRETIRDADKVSCFFPETSKVIVDHRPAARSFLIDLPEQLNDLENYYQFTFSGEEQVAMLPARILDISPKDRYRYARRIWIDNQQYLPLKVEVYDRSGNTIEQVVFTELEVKSSLPFIDVDSALLDKEVERIHNRQPMPFKTAGFVLKQVPGGFHKQFFVQMTMQGGNRPVEHLLLSDGFSSVSVYLENKSANIELGARSTDSVNAYSRIIDDHLVTVMGEVPEETVRYIAEGVELRTNTQ